MPGAACAPGRAIRRRTFLALAGGVAGAGLLAPATAPRAAPGGPAVIAAPPGPGGGPSAADWRGLRRMLSAQRLLRPGEAGYGQARLLFDPRFDGQRPAGVAYCHTPDDVAACLAFARRYGLPVAARSGGHSYAGWSGTSGLVVDVSGMDSFTVGPGERTVTAGAGLRMIDFYRRLAPRGLAVPGASCPTVGMAGLTLGGGVGVLSRAYGLACDNLTSLQMVTADGSVLDADESRHGDLFWACRGGGGGNFGVATAFTFRAHRLTRLVLFALAWPWSAAGRVVAGWQSWAPQAPDALWSSLHLSAAPAGPAPSVQVGGAYLGGASALEQTLGALYQRVGSAPSTSYLQDMPYLDAMLAEAGCAGLTAGQCHLHGQGAEGRLRRQPFYAKSGFFTRELPARAIEVLVGGLERLRGVRGGRIGATGAVAFDAFGGALNRVAPTATAFVHRDALFLAQYTTVWQPGTSHAQVASQHTWLRSVYASMQPYTSGQCYQNYIDPDLTDWRRAYYGANYARLAQVKAAYDPFWLLRFPQGIAPEPYLSVSAEQIV